MYSYGWCLPFATDRHKQTNPTDVFLSKHELRARMLYAEMLRRDAQTTDAGLCAWPKSEKMRINLVGWCTK